MFYCLTSQFGEFCIVFLRLHIQDTQKHKHANTATMAATRDILCWVTVFFHTAQLSNVRGRSAAPDKLLHQTSVGFSFFFFFFCLNSTVPGLYISTRKLICTINVWLRESFGHTLVARKVKPKTCCSFYADSFKWKSFSYSNYSTSLFRICLCCNLRKYFNISVHQSFRNMHHSSLDTLSTLFIISWLFKQRQENEQHGNKEHKWGIEILNWKWILFIFKQPAMI